MQPLPIVQVQVYIHEGDILHSWWYIKLLTDTPNAQSSKFSI